MSQLGSTVPPVEVIDAACRIQTTATSFWLSFDDSAMSISIGQGDRTLVTLQHPSSGEGSVDTIRYIGLKGTRKQDAHKAH